MEKDVLKEVVYDELVKKVNDTQINDTSNLVKKSDYITKIDEFEKAIPDHDQYITTQEFNKVTLEKAEKKLNDL